MAPPKVRADYEQLQDVAGRFGSQAQAARQTLQRLQQQMNVLQGGDWVGQGAQAFYAEMNSQVVPTMNRLIGALEQAADTTRQIRQVVQEAEIQAAAVFRSSGSTNGTGVGMPTGAPGSPNVVAFRPMAGPNGGGGSGAQKPPRGHGILDDLAGTNPHLAEAVKKHPDLQKKLLAMRRAGWWLEGGKGGEVSPDYSSQSPTLKIGPNATFEQLSQAVNHVTYDPAILANIGLDSKVEAQVRKNPLLMAELRRLGEDETRPWHISNSSQTAGQSIDFKTHQVEIDPDPHRQLASLKEQVWRAQRDAEDEWAGTPGKPRGSLWVKINADNRLTNDANEYLSTSAAYHDVHNKWPPSTYPLSVAPDHEAQLTQIAGEYANGNLDRHQAAQKIVDLMDSEPDNNMVEIHQAYYQDMLTSGQYFPWQGTKPPEW